jgi:myosin heavy subunit
MTDETNPPVQPVEPAVQPAPVTPAPTTPEINWEERYKGQVRATQLAVESKKSLEDQLLTQASESEQLKAKLDLGAQEKTVAVGERDKQLEVLLKSNQTLEAEMSRLKSLESKLKVANKLGRPELMQLVDHIPNLEDEEVLETVMKDFADFADQQVKVREDQLMSGLSPSAVQPSATPTTPQTAQDWERALAAEPDGTKEKATMLSDYGDWLGKQHNTNI